MTHRLTIDGMTRNLTTEEALYRVVRNLALMGDARALEFQEEMYREIEDPNEPSAVFLRVRVQDRGEWELRMARDQKADEIFYARLQERAAATDQASSAIPNPRDKKS